MEIQQSIDLENKFRYFLGEKYQHYSDSIRHDPCQALARALFEMLFQDNAVLTPEKKAKVLLAGIACFNVANRKEDDEEAESIAIEEVSSLLNELIPHE